jgi:hypothetical protein
MKALSHIILLLFITLNHSFAMLEGGVIAVGAQPQITIDPTGTVRVVYGNADRIYCATSTDNGVTFPNVKLVGEVKEMHLGMFRGPQAATSKNYTLVSAIDKHGSIHIFQLNHRSGEWTEKKLANDTEGSAPEGLMSLAADQKDNFYAVWLDIRDDKKNKICFASTADLGGSWSKNKIIYQSPDKTVCECCKPSIAVNKSKVLIMFRNWINGSRDLYLLQSDDLGVSFKTADKLGTGTWKLNGCPMDGGGLAIDSKNNISTVWQREGTIYFARPNENEEPIGTGRNCSLADAENPIITWSNGKMLQIKELGTEKEYDLGEGNFIKALRTTSGKILSVWENEGKVLFKSL